MVYKNLFKAWECLKFQCNKGNKKNLFPLGNRFLFSKAVINITSTKGTAGSGRRLLAYLLYYVIMANIHHYAPPVGCSVMQPHWLQHSSAVLVKVQSQVLNQLHKTNFGNYSIIN